MSFYSIEQVFKGIEMLGSTPKDCISTASQLWSSLSSILFPSVEDNAPVPQLAEKVIKAHPNLFDQIELIKKSPMLTHRLLKEFQRYQLQRFNLKVLPLINQMLAQINTNDSSIFCDAIALLYGTAKTIYSWLDVFDVNEEIRASFLSKIHGQSRAALSSSMLKHASQFFFNLAFQIDPPLSLDDCRSIVSKFLSRKEVDYLFSLLRPSPSPFPPSKECFVVHQLSEIGMLEQLEPLLIKVSKQRIAALKKKWNSEERFLPEAFNWLHHILFPTIGYCLHSMNIEEVYCTLIKELFEAFLERSAESIFHIVSNQDRLYDTLMDIHLCLKATNTYSTFTQVVQAQFKKRLLHPGAGTRDIIYFFVETIKFFRILDPTGSLLHDCTKDLCEYIRTQRTDTVKSMIQVLFDPSRGLKCELVGDEIVLPRQELVLKVTDQVDFDYRWKPPKVATEASGLKKTHFLPSADILSILVSVYQSKDIFIREYQTNMSESFMKKLDFRMDDFLEDIERLKSRFGEIALNACDAMVRDVQESFRFNENFNNEFLETNPVRALIISHLFWPSVDMMSCSLHPNIQRHLDEFAQCFEKNRISRHLQWLPNFGQVELEITLDHEMVPHKIYCSPLQASLLLFFTKCPKWNEKALAMETGLPPHPLQLILQFWCHMGFLTNGASTNEWLVLTTRNHPLITDITETDIDTKTPLLTSHDAQGSLYKNFIHSFLKVRPYTLDQLRANMTLVVVHGKKPEADTLERLLAEMIQQGTVEHLKDGRYTQKPQLFS